MPVLTPQERIGTVLDGKYRLERILGEGGFGVVFAATHLGLNRPVAIKILHTELSDRAEVVRRFLTEARATSKLEHPNVIDVRDVVTSPENGIYMVIELLEGESLAQLLARKQVLELDEAMAYLVPIVDAMCAAHAAGIVHRDIKPDNVFLSRGADGQIVPKLLDFGIAKLADGGPAMATATGLVLGTPIYMAPEQAMGRSKQIGPLSDVWSMAVMIYECLTGRFPFELPPDPSPTAVVLEVLSGRVVPLLERRGDLPPALGALLGRALERPLDQRLASMRELLESLQRAHADRVPVPSPSRPQPMLFPPTLLATGPIAQPAPSRPAAIHASMASTLVSTTGKIPSRPPQAAQHTGPIPGAVVALRTATTLGTGGSAATTTSQSLAQLGLSTSVPAWVWVAAAAAAAAGTLGIGIAVVSFSRRFVDAEGPTSIVEPPDEPVAAGPPESLDPVVPEPPPSIAPEAPSLDGVVPDRPTEVAETVTPAHPGEPRPEHAGTPRTRAVRGSEAVAVAVAPTPSPPPAEPEREHVPAPEPEDDVEPRSGVTHRASDVSLDDF